MLINPNTITADQHCIEVLVKKINSKGSDRMKITKDDLAFIVMFNDGYLEETISEVLNLTESEYEMMYNKLLPELDR